MAKQPATPPEASEKPADPAAEKKEPKKEKKPRPKEAKGEPEAPKAKPDTPAAPAAEGAPAAPKPAEAANQPAPESVNKKGRRPGTAPRRGKKLRNQLKNLQQKIAKEGPVPVKRAIGLLKQGKRAKFDETVEVHMSLGIDPTQNDQLVRGSVALPHGIGKSVRVLVFSQGDNAAKAKEAGADFAGSDELIKRIQQDGWVDFDVALATQDMMGMVSRLGKILGPRGLMPTPKAGTVITGDVAAAVREFKAGKVEYRADKGGNVHAGVGKLSFDENKLEENITTFVEQIRSVKPPGVKGNYIHSITVSATMSPGVPVTA
jgi:large subunit ribosomal protein L1